MSFLNLSWQHLPLARNSCHCAGHIDGYVCDQIKNVKAYSTSTRCFFLRTLTPIPEQIPTMLQHHLTSLTPITDNHSWSGYIYISIYIHIYIYIYIYLDCSSPSPSRFSEVYEELLRPFGGRIPKRVKTQVAAAAELGDVKARKNWNGDVKPRWNQ